ncbi:MAG: hypothetical protein LBI92_02560 [Azoarcus sp.]|jgi:hypothetical protein|nr:hypothetical protein [Azoarcus sp.]
MSDAVDQMQEREDRRDAAMRRVGRIAPASPAATGFCLNCAEPLLDGRRWCDAECRDNWERMDTMLKARGL